MTFYKVVLNDTSFFYISGHGLFPHVETIDNSEKNVIVFYNCEKEVLSQVIFDLVKSVFAVHYDTIEPYYEDVTDELRRQCKSSRGGDSGDIVRPPFGSIAFTFDDYILRFLEIIVDIGLCVSFFVILMILLKNFLGGIPL